MREVLTLKEKSELLIVHANRLKVFAEKLGAPGRCLIESESYAILEVFAPTPRAICRYAWRAFKSWRRETCFSVEAGIRIWWYRRARGLDYGDAVDLACARIEGKHLK